MYIEKFEIQKFRVLKNIEITFQCPGSATADPETGNVVNVIAGVNGCGKTSILDALSGHHDDYVLASPPNLHQMHLTPHSGEKIVYFPAHLEGYVYKNENVSMVSWGVRSIQLDINSLLDDVEAYISSFIVAEERKIFSANPMVRAEKAVTIFNNLFNDLGIQTKLISLASADHRNRPLFTNSLAESEVFTLNQLSDGEKRVYSRVLKLMMLAPENSIILIDEPEIALHPAWQQKIMTIYSRIGKNNQFIVATHSPQVIASVPYQNRILLRKENGKIIPVHCAQPPSGLDVNSILAEIMGADPRPPEILDLYRQYRKLVEERKEKTPEALIIKDKLSQESEHSQFMQEMNFLIELRDA